MKERPVFLQRPRPVAGAAKASALSTLSTPFAPPALSAPSEGHGRLAPLGRGGRPAPFRLRGRLAPLGRAGAVAPSGLPAPGSCSGGHPRAAGLAVLWAAVCLLAALFAPLANSAEGRAGKKPVFTVRGLGGGGGLYSPSISPYDANLVFAACDMGGVYRSENGGRGWAMLSANHGLSEMHRAPKPVFLAGRIYWITEKRRICFSDDDGRTWDVLPPGPWKNSVVVSLAAVKGTPDTLLVSTESGVWRGPLSVRSAPGGPYPLRGKALSRRPFPSAGLWERLPVDQGGPVAAVGESFYVLSAAGDVLVSRDLGKSWTRTAQLGGQAKALAGRRAGGEDTLLASVEPKGLMLSGDSGRTWRLVKQPYENETILAMPPARKEMYALQSNSDAMAKLLRSDDGGASWRNIFRMPPGGKMRVLDRAVANVLPSWVQTELSWGYYFTYQGLDVAAGAPDFALVTTQGEIYATRDGGESWAPIMNDALPPLDDGRPRFASTGLEVTSCWGYFFDPHDEKREYIAYTDVGFGRSLDRGASWSWSAWGSPWTNTFYDLAFDPARPGRIYAAASQQHDIPHFLAVSSIAGGYRVHRGGVVVSDDYGATWKTPYAGGGPGSLPKQVCTTVVLDPNSPPDRRTLYAGVFGERDDDAAGVYVSRDSGATWARLEPGPGVLPNLHIYRLRLHPRTGHLYCLITGLRSGKVGGYFAVPGGLWKSEDKGANWRHISAGAPFNRWSTAFAFDPRDSATVYVTAATPQGGRDVGGLFKTVNDGADWFHVLKDGRIGVSGGEPGYDHCMAVTVHPDNPDLVMVGTTLHGIMYSTDRGRFWRRYWEFPFGNAQSITVHPRKRDRIYVTTFGAGVWEGPLPE